MAVDLNGIKDQIKSILDTANTTTATYDLSTNMDERVTGVYRLRPERLRDIGDHFPLVTVYTVRKNTQNADVALSLQTGKRFADVTFEIAGVIYDTDFVTDNTENPSQNEAEYLMENVEQVLRNNGQLNSTVKWHTVNNVDYFALPVTEESHYTVAVMELECRVQY
jgi:hypothetical protein